MSKQKIGWGAHPPHHPQGGVRESRYRHRGGVRFLSAGQEENPVRKRGILLLDVFLGRGEALCGVHQNFRRGVAVVACARRGLAALVLLVVLLYQQVYPVPVVMVRNDRVRHNQHTQHYQQYGQKSFHVAKVLIFSLTRETDAKLVYVPRNPVAKKGGIPKDASPKKHMNSG